MYYNNSTINRSDGVVVYIQNDINEMTTIYEFGKLKILNIQLNLINNQNLTLSAVYRSHDLPCLEFILNLNNYLNKMKNFKSHIVVGDFNINIINDNDISQEFINNFLEKGFYPGFKSITRPSDTGDGGTCIDNIFIKTNSLTNKTFKLEVPFADHYPIFISLNKLKESARKNAKIYYNYKKLENVAKHKNWLIIESMQDPNEAIDHLINEIKDCIARSKNIPKKNKCDGKPRSDWISKAVIVSCDKKEQLYNKNEK